MISKTYSIIAGIFSLMLLISCSKKTTPARTPEEPAKTVIVPDTIKAVDTVQSPIKKTDSVLVKKAPPVKPKPKETIPKVIAVGDNAAKKSVDGRLYYDLQGHRYWRNNKDGKYYLYNKSMATDPDFKKVD